MLLSEGVKHTDAAQQARFAQLTQEQQLLEIWLNGRETNGHVADAMRDIAVLKETIANKIEPRVAKVERIYLIFAGIGAAAIVVAPFVFWAIENIRFK